MPIQKVKFGKHEDVLFAEFGTGDIKMTKGRYNDETHESLLMFSTEDGHKIGDTTDADVGKFSDDLPAPDFVLSFKKPESLTALIHSLIELQKELFKSGESAASVIVSN
jgi:hypothetical protein